MPRGGKRSPSPGKNYPQRTDLQSQPVRTTPNQTYGEAGAQAAAQQVVPLPQTAQSVPTPTPLNSPTQRPAEPVTAGIPQGPGPGPEALGPPASTLADDDVEGFLRAVATQYPNTDVERLLAAHTQKKRG